MTPAEEIVVKLTAQTAELKAGMAEGAAVVKATQDEMAASMQTSMNAFREFDSIQKGSITTAAQLASAQEAVRVAQASGAFTSEELAAKQALLAEAMTKVARDAKAAAVGMGALTSNSRTMYSVSALISDAMTGQFSRSRREVAALSNETGLMARAFRFAVSPAGILALGVGALGAAAIEAGRDFDSFEQAVQESNGYMGTTAGELQALAQKIGDLTNSYGNAKEAVIGLADSGRFTGAQLEQAATAAVKFSDLTGEKVSEVDKLIIRMATDPQKALDELVDKYHRVTPAQASVIEGLIKEGDKAAATTAMVKAMGTSVSQSFDLQAQHAGALSRVLRTLGHDFGEVWRGIGNSLQLATGGGDAAEKLSALQHQLADMRASGETTGGYKVAYEHIQQEAEALQKVIDKEHESADAARKAAAAWSAAHPEKGSFAAIQKEGLGGIDLGGNMTKQLSILEAAQHTTYDKMQATAANYWQYVLEHEKVGTAQYIEAYHQVEENNKRVDDEQLADSERTERKREELARKSQQTATRAAEEQARAVKHAQAEIQAEIRKTGQAMDEAMRKQITDAQQAANASVQAATDTYAKIADALHFRAQMHEITVQQEVAAERRAAEQEYTDKRKALQRELTLVQSKPAEVARINAEIEQLERKHDLLMQKLAEKSALDYQKTWQERLRPISNAFDQMINGMMQGTQTLGQAMRNMLQNIAASFIQMGIDTVTNWIANEIAKREATQMTAVQQIANAAGVAGAQGVASFAGAPWPIDIGAPAFGAAMALDALAYQAMASAAGGWERVPADGMLTELHRDEMVLPAHIANPMRDMVRSGGAGGGTHHHHYTIKAYDRRGLSDFIARNGIELGKGLQRLARNGHRP